jgi:hypothetical protein
VLKITHVLISTIEEARDEVERYIALRKFKSIAVLKARAAPPPSAHAFFDRLVEGLRKAGMPED